MKQVYVHGLGQTPSSWEETVSRLNGGEPAVCLDLAGMVRGKRPGMRIYIRRFPPPVMGSGAEWTCAACPLGAYWP